MNANKLRKILIFSLIGIAVIGIILALVIVFTTVRGNRSEEEHHFMDTVVAPTCTEQGYTLHACACGYGYKTNPKPATGHKFKIYDAKEATCTEDGHSEYEGCENAGCDLKTGFTSYRKIGHMWGDPEVKEATCMENGSEIKTCLRDGCGEKEEITLPKKGHDFVLDISSGKTVKATCYSKGNEHYECSRCDATQDIGIAEAEHSYTSVDTATCTEDGETYLWCKYEHRDENSVRPSPAKGHKLKEGEYESRDEKTHTQICTECEKPITAEHNIVVYPNSFQPTTHMVGCRACGLTRDEKHTYSYAINEHTHKSVCVYCNVGGRSDNVPVNHDFEDGRCRECKYDDWTKNLGVAPNADGTYSITGMGSSDASELKIPKYYYEKSIINGHEVIEKEYPITAIADWAFNSRALKSVTIFDNIVNIGSNAFVNNYKLETVTFDGVKNELRIGEDAFSGCTKLSMVNVKDINSWCKISFANRTANPISNDDADLRIAGLSNFNTLATIGENTEIKQYAFIGSKSLGTVTLSGVTSIGKSAFEGCGLASLSLTGTEFVIAENAFKGCRLKNVTLSGVTSIGESAFEDGITANSPTLTISNADNLEIGARAFAGCSALNNLNHIKATSVGDNAFEGCTSLVWANLDNVQRMGSNVFMGCTKLNAIRLNERTRSGFVTLSKDAFKELTTLETVEIYDITSIGESAFEGCGKISALTLDLPEQFGTLQIGARAFYGCALIPVFEFQNVISIGESAFAGCTSLSTLKIYADEPLEIDSDSFKNCNNVTQIEFSGITGIGDNAFKDCTSLGTLSLVGIRTIGASAFEGCAKISALTLSLPQQSDTLQIGAKAFKGCVLIPALDFQNVTNFGERAFEGCTGITNLTIGAAEEIGVSTFEGCSSIKELTLGEGVGKINDRAFANCSAITTINYNAAYAYSEDTCANYDFSEDEKKAVFAGVGSGTTTAKSVIVNIGCKVQYIPSNFLRYTYVNYIVFDTDQASLLKKVGENTLDSKKLNSNFKIYFASEFASNDVTWNNVVQSDDSFWKEANIYYYTSSSSKPNDGRKYWHYRNGNPSTTF